MRLPSPKHGDRSRAGGLRDGLLARIVILAALAAPAGTLGAPEIRGVPKAERAAALQRASRAMADGRPEEVLRELAPHRATGRGEARAEYLRARALLESGSYEEALSALPNDLEALPDGVAEGVDRLRALLLSRLGHCERAVPALSRLSRKHPKDAQLPLLRGHCLWKMDKPEPAAAALAEALRLDPRGRILDSAQVRFDRAQLLRAAGHEGAARAELKALWLEEPQHPLAIPIGEALGPEVTQASLGYEERFARARRLLDALDFEGAARAFRELPPPRNKAALGELLHYHGLALFRSRDRYGDAHRVLSRSASLGTRFSIEDAFMAARALARADRDREAVREFDRFVRRNPRSALAGQAAYLAAWLSLRHGFPGANMRMARFVDGRQGRGLADKRSEGLFELGLAALSRRQFEAAQGYFMRYAGNGSDPMVSGRGRYWAARAAMGKGARKQAERLLAEVRELSPLHYYAQLASLRLTELRGGQPPPPLLAAPEPPSAIDRTHRPVKLDASAQFFADLGLLSDASAALSAMEPRSLARSRDLNEVLRWSITYERLGASARAARLVARFQDTIEHAPARGRDALLYRLAYPRPYAPAVRSQCRIAGLDEELLYSIMRKESFFDPAALSFADAIGLLQLLPSTAASVADAAGLSFERGALFNPEDNIRLGVRYLSSLLSDFPQHPALAVAAYNAGNHHVESWLLRVEARRRRREFGAVDLDRLVEDIPIVQTRNYVRRVFTNWAVYRYLAGHGEMPVWSMGGLSGTHEPSSESVQAQRRGR